MKKLKAIIAVLLAASLLCGCSATPVDKAIDAVTERVENVKDGVSDAKDKVKNGITGTKNKVASFFDSLLGREEPEPEDPYAEAKQKRAEKAVCFDEIEYERPDCEVLADRVAELEDVLDAGKLKLAEIEEYIDKVYDEYYHFYTMYTVADIRNCLDLTDEFYDSEFEWISEQSATVDDLIDEMYFACGGSKYAQDLEDDYFWEGFAEEYADIADSMYTPEMVALMEKESNLVSEYRDIIAEPTVVYKGREMPFEEALEKAENNMYAVGTYDAFMEYLDTLLSYYDKYTDEIGGIFIELIKVRAEMAKEGGYDSYEEMAYDFTYERDYTPEQAASFMTEVEEYIIPLYNTIGSAINYDAIVYDDLSERKLESCVETVARTLGGTAEEAFDYMQDYEMFDFSVCDTKSPMSFQTYLYDYEAPYLLIDASGDTSDIMTAVHEFGHYTDSFGCYGSDEALELCETFSQGLEFLSVDMLKNSLNDTIITSISLEQISSILNTYVQQCAFAEFEHEVYALPIDSITVEQINDIALSVAQRFGFAEEGIDEYYSRYWIDIPHFFEQAFYVISYPVSVTVSLQFADLEMEEKGTGIAKFEEMLQHDSGDFLKTLEEYDMDSPFDEGVVKYTAKVIKNLYKKLV